MHNCEILERVRAALGDQLPTRAQVHAIINAELNPTMDMTMRCVLIVHTFEHILDIVGEIMDGHVFNYVDLYGIDMEVLGRARMIRNIAKNMDLEVLGIVEIKSMDDLADAMQAVNLNKDKEVLH